jgi:hypothetical protein
MVAMIKNSRTRDSKKPAEAGFLFKLAEDQSLLLPMMPKICNRLMNRL